MLLLRAAMSKSRQQMPALLCLESSPHQNVCMWGGGGESKQMWLLTHLDQVMMPYLSMATRRTLGSSGRFFSYPPSSRSWLQMHLEEGMLPDLSRDMLESCGNFRSATWHPVTELLLLYLLFQEYNRRHWELVVSPITPQPEHVTHLNQEMMSFLQGGVKCAIVHSSCIKQSCPFPILAGFAFTAERHRV